MRIAPSATILAFLLTAILPVSASAQVTTKTEGLSLNDTLVQLLKPISPAPVGEAVAFATAIEIATTPFGTTSGGFVFKLDPTTGLRVQSASTFGPSFAERALTTGAGKMNVAANLTIATYDRLGDFNLSGMQLSSIKGASNAVTRTGNASLVMSSQTLVITGTAGVTDDLDIGVAVPLVKVKVDGLSWVQRADDVVALRATGSGIASGLGDIAATAKYRFLKFGQDQPDPGGMAFSLVYHMPTGNRANLRGLGMHRALGSVVYSSGRGKFRPHGNVGFEWWEKGLTVQSSVSGVTPYSTVEARHMLQYAAGAEFEATPRITLIVGRPGPPLPGRRPDRHAVVHDAARRRGRCRHLRRGGCDRQRNSETGAGAGPEVECEGHVPAVTERANPNRRQQLVRQVHAGVGSGVDVLARRVSDRQACPGD